ncbi:MAG: hypothetical protein JW820_13625 [Spirochaetales bacterium]|nr:hypothetical protein [Spirochaetales bacterium]
MPRPGVGRNLDRSLPAHLFDAQFQVSCAIAASDLVAGLAAGKGFTKVNER